MHELSVCQGIIAQVTAVVRKHGAGGVGRIRVSVGPLSGVEPALLREAFPLARAGTVAERAELEIDSLPVKVRCRTCGAETEARANRLLCGQCGDWQTQLVSGDELLLSSVELLDAATSATP